MSKLAKLKIKDDNLEKVRGWLNWIGEKCTETRKEVRENCINDPECMAYFVGRFDARGSHDRCEE